MSTSTITRAFQAQPLQMISEATKLANSSAYAVKKFFYNLVTFGCGKAIQEARATRRENEITNMAKDVLSGLPEQYSELTSTTPKILHTNMNEKYQITLEGNNLCLYTGTVSHSWFGSGNSSFNQDPASKVVLKTISSDEDLTKLRKELTIVKEYNQLSTNRNRISQNDKLTLAKELTEAKTQKDKLKQETITEKTNIVFQDNGGNFNHDWEKHLKHITAQNYQIGELTINNELVYKVSNRHNPAQYILIVGKKDLPSGRKMITAQINEFFSQNPAGTLETFLNQPVAVNDSNKYRLLKSAYASNFASENMSYLYPLLEHYLDNY